MKQLRPLLDHHTRSLEPFVAAGVFDSAAVHVAGLIARNLDNIEESVLLGAALAVRAPQFGNTCVVPTKVADTVIVDDAQLITSSALPWPDPDKWAKLLADSPAVRNLAHAEQDPGRPLVWDGTRLYLERYWRFEKELAADLLSRANNPTGFTTESSELETVLGRCFNDHGQHRAARVALTRGLAVICGGPGTGKTTTIARLVQAALEIAKVNGRPVEIALAAPTGKAARRLTQAVHDEVGDTVGDLVATTLHRLLGSRPRHKNSRGRNFQLPHDIVIVDEASMVALPMFAKLLDAVRPEATLVIVGDPGQLQSIEAGAVLAEIVGNEANPSSPSLLRECIVELQEGFRADRDLKINELAAAIRRGDADAAIKTLAEGSLDKTGIRWIDADDEAAVEGLRTEVIEAAKEVVRGAKAISATTANRDEAIREELAVASDLKVLCATRYGPLGTYKWTDLIEAALPEKISDAWYVGRPVIVTVNDPLMNLLNGDVGVALNGVDRRVVAFREGPAVREVAIAKLGNIDTWWAMTIHKSQGSEFPHVIVTLPAAPSPSLTCELLYTAVTRAKKSVTIVASEESIRTAIGQPAERASGLGGLLWG